MIAVTEAVDLLELEASAHAEVLLPADAHVIGEPVTVTQIRYAGCRAWASSRRAGVPSSRTR